MDSHLEEQILAEKLSNLKSSQQSIEKRKGFGSCARGLKELMLGEKSPPPLDFSRRRSRSVSTVTRSSRYIKTIALAWADEACKMRRWLNETYIVVAQQSKTTLQPMDTSTKGGQQPLKSAAAIAAEVADRRAACPCSQSIMASVLSRFAEEAKNARLAMSSSAFSSFPTPSVNTLSNLPPTAPPSNTYQSLLVQQPTLQLTQTPVSSQTRYHMVSTPYPQHYVQPSVVMVNSCSHVFSQQLPAPPSFRSVGLFQPPGMVYYGRPYQSS